MILKVSEEEPNYDLLTYLKRSPIPNTPLVEEYTPSILGALLACFLRYLNKSPGVLS